MVKIQTSSIFSKVNEGILAGATLISAQGSSRSSKTYNILIWLINYTLTNENIRLSIVRKSLPSLKGSVMVDFKEILYRMQIFHLVKENKTNLTYYFHNKSWIEFFSADDEQKLRGRKRDLLYVNEANELSLLEWQQLRMRTTRFSIIDYNPSFGDNHWICDINRDSRTFHFITTYKDNPFLEQTVIDEIESLQKTNPALWQIYGLGQRSMALGRVFTDYSLFDKLPDDIRWQWAGVDFGFSHDPTAIIRVAISKKNIYLDEVCYKTHMLTSDIVKSLKERCQGLSIICDSADPRLVREIARAGVMIKAVKKYAGSIEAGLAKMHEFRICVSKRSLNLITELNNYSYMTDSDGALLNSPIDDYNHAIDAVRYVVLTNLMISNNSAASDNAKRLRKLVY